MQRYISTVVKTTQKNVATMTELTDIGANLLDSMYQGHYHKSKKHKPDVDQVIQRATQHHVKNIFITAGTLEDSKAAVQFIRERKTCPSNLYTTVGIHPTMASHIEALHDAHKGAEKREHHFAEMLELIKQSPEIIAIGECGLDADRTHFAPMDAQRVIFPYHLNLAEVSGLPLFLHDRNCGTELFDIIAASQSKLPGGGVCHSFTGSLDLAEKWCSLPSQWMIGINGCSLKTAENCEAVASIPLDRILIETDAPWCEIKASHHSSTAYLSTKGPDTRWRFCAKEKFDAANEAETKQSKPGVLLVKGRNEPCTLIRVVEAIAAIKNIDVDVVCRAVKENTDRLFFNNAAVQRRVR